MAFRRIGGIPQYIRVFPFACASISVTIRYLPWTNIIENSVIAENTQLMLGERWKLLRVYYMDTGGAGNDLGSTILGLHLNANVTPFRTRSTTALLNTMVVEDFENDSAVADFAAADRLTLSLDVAGSGADIVGCAHVRLLQ